MAAPLKTAGLREVDALQKRARRQHALGRIGETDYDRLEKTINILRALILNITEEDGNGQAISNPSDQ